MFEVRKRIAESPEKSPPVTTVLPDESVDVVVFVREAMSERTTATLLTSSSASLRRLSASVATVILTDSLGMLSTVRSTPSSTPSKVLVALSIGCPSPAEGHTVIFAFSALASCVVATSPPAVTVKAFFSPVAPVSWRL